MINFPVPYLCVNEEFAEEVRKAMIAYQSLEVRYEQLINSTEAYRRRRDVLLKEVKLTKQSNKIAGRNRTRKVCHFEVNGRYICHFRKCNREYGSELALNHHMRMKHNAGTKT